MTHSIATAVLAVLLPAAYALAQQPQQPPTPTTTIPCSKNTPAQPHKPGYLEKKAKALACKQNKQFCDLPSSPTEITGVTPDAKPCPANTVASPTQAKAQAQPTLAPSAAPATAPANSKPVLVCPPKSTLIPGYPYCMNPDHSLVDAIALPASLSAPAPPASAVPAQAQH